MDSYVDRVREHEASFGKMTSREEVIAQLFYGYGGQDAVDKVRELNRVIDRVGMDKHE